MTSTSNTTLPRAASDNVVSSYVWTSSPNEKRRDLKRVHSSEVRKLRAKKVERSGSQSTLYFTPRVSPSSSFYDGDESRQSPDSTSLPRALARTASAPLKKPRSKTKQALRRLTSCFVHNTVQDEEAESTRDLELTAMEENSLASSERLPSPRRLRSGGPNGIDLLRFEKTEAQHREFHSPSSPGEMLCKSASLPIPSRRKSPVEEGDEYTPHKLNFARNLQRLKRMSGTYRLVRSKSDSVQPMSDLLEFNWALRKALENSDVMQVINSLFFAESSCYHQIQVDDCEIHQTGRVFKLVDLAEHLPLSGQLLHSTAHRLCYR
jgi:hypothetical protein